MSDDLRRVAEPLIREHVLYLAEENGRLLAQLIEARAELAFERQERARLAAKLGEIHEHYDLHEKRPREGRVVRLGSAPEEGHDGFRIFTRPGEKEEPRR